MFIGIDGNEANVVNRVGSNHYAYEILKALSLGASTHQYVVYLKNPPLNDLPPESNRWHYNILRPTKLWTQWRLPLSLYARFPRPDVFFSPGHYAPRFSPTKTVVTILDLAFLHHPSLFLKHKRGVTQLTQWTEYSVKKARFVFAISAHTKQDIIKTYRKPEDQVAIAYPGIDEAIFKPQPEEQVNLIKRRYHLKVPYILHVGTLQPRKNLDRLLSAYESIPKKGNRLELILAGAEGWLLDEFKKKLHHSPKKDYIKLLGYIPMPDLPALYAGSLCTVSVGLEEGFGLPPAEALACGATVVASKTGALPEVVGESGIMVDPYSVTSIRHGLVSALNQTEKVKAKRRKLGVNHVMQFNWAKTAKIIEDKLYELTLS